METKPPDNDVNSVHFLERYLRERGTRQEELISRDCAQTWSTTRSPTDGKQLARLVFVSVCESVRCSCVAVGLCIDIKIHAWRPRSTLKIGTPWKRSRERQRARQPFRISRYVSLMSILPHSHPRNSYGDRCTQQWREALFPPCSFCSLHPPNTETFRHYCDPLTRFRCKCLLFHRKCAVYRAPAGAQSCSPSTRCE